MEQKTEGIVCRLGSRRELIVPKIFCRLLKFESGTQLLVQPTPAGLLITELPESATVERLRKSQRGRPTWDSDFRDVGALYAIGRFRSRLTQQNPI